MDAAAAVLDAAGAVFIGRRDFARARRQGVIAASAELRDARLIKLAHLADAVAEALLRPRRRRARPPA